MGPSHPDGFRGGGPFAFHRRLRRPRPSRGMTPHNPSSLPEERTSLLVPWTDRR
nr:MAG TPA: hypothetical protein [Caudoviricetes sp.]